MGKKIKDLKDRISSTIQLAQQLKVFHDVVHLSQPSTSTSELRSESGAELRSWRTLEKDSPAVAVDHKVEEIVTLLENPAIGCVAVVGMGGLGKTFLLQHVFERSKHRYDCSAWISVSKTFFLRKLQCDLASHIDLKIDNSVSDLRAAELIHHKLDGRKCLIVLDDVWRSIVECNNLLSRIGLPTGRGNQCKILVTTRSRDVCENMNADIYEMQQLSEDESWDLFCQHSFLESEGNRPPEHLESLAHQIVQECGRLPLTIKRVAASMARSSLRTDWESKLLQLKKLGKGEDGIIQILKMSYDSLPSPLKFCFAYFSFFPEDTRFSFSTFKIDKTIYQDYVIHLWMAEGFIPQVKDREQWDIGLDYLHQLESLCLLDVDRVTSCYTLHDLLHSLVVNICKENECEFDLRFGKTSFRRLLLANKGIATDNISERPLSCQRFLRTLSFSQNPLITKIPQQLLDHQKVLRIIDLSHTAISTLPKCFGKFKLLKVLNLSYTEIREVPDCVRRLKSLQLLDVSHCTSIDRVPEWIGELKCLSHLNVQGCPQITNRPMPKGVSQLLHLRTLRSDYFPLSTDDKGFFNIKDVGSLINLCEISFSLKDASKLESLEDGILDRLVKLRFLGVRNPIPAKEGHTEGSILPVFPEKMKDMKDLEQLEILGFSVPSWMGGMEKMTNVVLTNCSDYSSLQKMPNLQLLMLRDDSKCRKLPNNFGERGGFPNLVRLQIINFPLLEELPDLEDGAMQSLEGLWIVNCPQVKKVPEGLERLKRLKRLSAKQASGEFEKRLKKEGEDWEKIKSKKPRTEIRLY